MGRMRWLVTGALVGAALAGLPAGAAAWGTPVSTTGMPTSTPFAPWGDQERYFTVPGGTFEGGLSEWRLTGATRLVAESRLDGSGRAVGAAALRLEPGAVATARTVRVKAGEDVARFFARSATATSAVVHIQAKVTVPGSPNLAYMDSAIIVGRSWSPLKRFNLPIMLGPDGTEDVELRIWPEGGAAIVIDDVMIDPWKNR